MSPSPLQNALKARPFVWSMLCPTSWWVLQVSPPLPSIPIEQELSELLKEEGNRAQSWFFSAKVTEPPGPKDHMHQGSTGPEALGEAEGHRFSLLAQGPLSTVDTICGDVFLFPAWAREEAEGPKASADSSWKVPWRKRPSTAHSLTPSTARAQKGQVGLFCSSVLRPPQQVPRIHTQ